jgi:diacylglycerol kinase family enzyme
MAKMKQKYRIAFVINELSRGGSTRPQIRENLYKLVEYFQRETGQQVAVLFSRNRDHIKKSLGPMQAQGFNTFVTYGGDGTINDTIQALNEGAFLLPIPAGNANDMASRLQLRNTRDTILAFEDTLHILEDLLNGRINVVGLDIGEVTFEDALGNKHRRRFANNMGIGVTADTVKRIDGMVRKNYALAGLSSIMEAKPFRVNYTTLMMDEAEYLDTLGFEALLCRKVGNYAYMAPFKRENNEAMHFFVINPMARWKRLLFVILIKFGTIATAMQMGEYFHEKAKLSRRGSMNIEGISGLNLSFNDPLPMHVDGNMVPEFEQMVQKKVSIQIRPKFLTTIAPC